MMSPLKVLLSIISLFVVLAIVAVVYPEGGIHVGDYTLRYPKLTDIFEKDSGKLRDSTQEDPEEAIREMMEAKSSLGNRWPKNACRKRKRNSKRGTRRSCSKGPEPRYPRYRAHK